MKQQVYKIALPALTLIIAMLMFTGCGSVGSVLTGRQSGTQPTGTSEYGGWPTTATELDIFGDPTSSSDDELESLRSALDELLKQIEQSLPTGGSDKLPTSTTALPETGIWEEGVYLVGVDIPAGEYCAIGDYGYVERYSDDTLAYESMIAFTGVWNRAYFLVEDGEYLIVDELTVYPIEDSPEVPLTGNLPSGMYRVGVDIEPGEYTIVSDGVLSAYYAVLDSIDHSSWNIIYYDMVEIDDAHQVIVEEGEILEINYGELIR